MRLKSFFVFSLVMPVPTITLAASDTQTNIKSTVNANETTQAQSSYQPVIKTNQAIQAQSGVQSSLSMDEAAALQSLEHSNQSLLEQKGAGQQIDGDRPH